MSAPLISVILPVYNGGEYLAQAVESVLTQTFADFELIIINDGSTDNSWEIIQNYAREDGRIKAFAQANKGLVATLNRGLAKARGVYLARMDSDDICFAHRFAAQVEALEARPELGVLGGALALIDGKGRIVSKQTYPRGKRLKERLLYGSLLCHPLAMGRTELFRSAGGYRAYYRHCEDYDLWLRLSRLTELDNLTDTLLFYRVHEANITNKHAAAQIFGTLVAQGVYLIALRTGRDITEELAPPGVDTLEKLPLTQDERKGLYLRLLPMYFRTCADPLQDAFVLKCMAWLTPRLTGNDGADLHYFQQALARHRP